MIARTRGGVALTDSYPELEDPLQGHHLPPAVVRDPQGIATLWTCPLKRPQGGCELCFGFVGSPGHRLPPACHKDQRYHLSVHPLSRRVCRSAKKRIAQSLLSQSAKLGQEYRSRQTFLVLLCKPLLYELVQNAEILALNGWDHVLAANVNTVGYFGKLLGVQRIGPGRRDQCFEIRQSLLVDPLLVNSNLFFS